MVASPVPRRPCCLGKGGRGSERPERRLGPVLNAPGPASDSEGCPLCPVSLRQDAHRLFAGRHQGQPTCRSARVPTVPQPQQASPETRNVKNWNLRGFSVVTDTLCRQPSARQSARHGTGSAWGHLPGTWLKQTCSVGEGHLVGMTMVRLSQEEGPRVRGAHVLTRSAGHRDHELAGPRRALAGRLTPGPRDGSPSWRNTEIRWPTPWLCFGNFPHQVPSSLMKPESPTALGTAGEQRGLPGPRPQR